jgi:hypothetical protein
MSKGFFLKSQNKIFKTHLPHMKGHGFRDMAPETGLDENSIPLPSELPYRVSNALLVSQYLPNKNHCGPNQ